MSSRRPFRPRLSASHWAAIGITLALLGCLRWVESLGPQLPPRDAAPRRVDIARVSDLPVPTGEEEDFLGVVLPQRAVDISARLDGQLERLKAQVGDRLKTGTELGALDRRMHQQDLAVAEAALEGARAEEKRAETNAEEKKDRMERSLLPSAGVLSEEEIMGARYQHRAALASVAAAHALTRQRQADVERIRARLAECSLRMPFDGVVAVRYVDEGAQVRAGTPLLRVIQQEGLLIRFALPEERNGPSVGDGARVVMPGATRPLVGRVISVSPEVDAASRMLFVLASFELPQGMPAPAAGKLVRVRLGGGETLTRAYPTMSAP